MEDTRTRINVNRIKPGMTVACDIHTPKGLLLIPKGTVIDESHIFRIRLYQISTIDICVQEGEAAVTKGIEERINENLDIELTKSFSEFSQRYSAHKSVTQEKLNDILEGKSVTEAELFEVTSVLISSLRTKSELFNYLYYLKEENDHTFTHCLNVSLYAYIFANWLKLPDDQVREVTVCGLLHDIGKIEIDRQILHKPGKLTEQEYRVIKQHSIEGHRIIEPLDVSNAIKDGVLHHHEKLDGSGYPMGLTGERIPLYARMICIADIYDAMTSKRSYHEKYSPFKVMRVFEKESKGLIDPELLYTFLENIAHNYLGCDIMLSTGERARIVLYTTNPITADCSDQ